MSVVQYVIARTPDDIDAVRGLFMEYGASLDFDLCFQGFDEELATLLGKYAAPSGCLYLMRCQNGDAVGCVGVRPLAEAGCAEMKRLYVRDNWRGDGLGRELAHRAISFAREAGYSTLRLDTLPDQMVRADAMYRRLGFVPTAAYHDNPVAGATYYGLSLTRGTGAQEAGGLRE